MQNHSLETDFCIIGGGMTGVCASLAAARTGAKVILVQDRSMLGGNASSEIKMHIVGADCHGKRPGARETGILEELRLEDAYRNPHRSFSLWDWMLYEKVQENPNITLLLDSCCIGCQTEKIGNFTQIAAAEVLRASTEDHFTIQAKYFADCSGDGMLGFSAGADFRVGRESKDEHGESLALEKNDSQTLGSSILFTARKHDTPQPFISPSWTRKFSKDDFKLRPIGGYEYGYWWFEWGGQLNTIKDAEKIRHELARISLGVWDYIKNSGNHPDSANWALDWVGVIPGKRESRRFLGHHILTQQDVESGRIFDDQVAYGGWWLDLHPPTGVDSVNEPPCVQHHTPYLFSIPLRCLYSRNIGNLFFAGRNMSATHVAFASTRVMGTCAVMGQAIGTAASICLQKNVGTPLFNALDSSTIHKIQQTLLKDGAFLLGIQNEDQTDLAKQATCRASSETPNSPAAAVINGIHRPLHSSFGKWATESTNYWEAENEKAWLELNLKKETLVSEIRITFNSGLERELILSPSDYQTQKVVRGPQPEIVRDYDIYMDDQKVKSIRGNIQRLNIHHLETPLPTKKIRIETLSTNGHPHAIIQEVRLY